MKILQVANLFSPQHGGSAVYPYSLSTRLAQRKHEVTIYTTDYRMSQEWLSAARALHIKVRGFRTWLNLANFQFTPGLLRASKEIRGLDVIHMHNFRTFQNMVVHHYARRYNIPYVLHAHGSLTTFFYRGWLKRAFDRLWGHRILRHASKVIAITGIESHQYGSMGVSEDRIVIVPLGVAPADFESLPPRGEFRRRYGLSDTERIVLYLGRLHKIKGLDLLAGAFAELSRQLDDARLVIAGPDDGYLRSLRQLVADLQITDKVLFTGPLYGQEKLRAYVDADVYVLPSSYEIFGITVLEACACGTPVIVTDRCGIADVINDQAGLVVPPEREALSTAIAAVLRDNNRARDFGENGRSMVRETFSWERVTRQVEDVYLSCLSARR